MSNFPNDLPEVPGGTALAIEMLMRVGVTSDAVSPRKILIIGCRSGASAIAAANQWGCAVTGIDEEPESILAAKVAAESGPARNLVRFRVMSPVEPDLPGNGFDVIFLEAVINSYPKRDVLKACRKNLRPDGRLLITDATWKQRPVPPYVRDLWETREQPILTMEEWDELLASSGFTRIDTVDATRHLDQFYRHFARLYDDRSSRHAGETGTYRRLVARYRHESNVYLKRKGNKWMGFVGIIAARE